jgi:hypothetical protein
MARFGVKEVADVTFYDMNDVPVLYLDTLKLTNLTNEAERTYVRGGRSNSILMAFDYNRTATFEIQDALLNPRTVALQTGVELSSATQSIHKRESLTVQSVTPAGGGTAVLAIVFAETPTDTVRIYPSENGYEQDNTGLITVEPASVLISDAGDPYYAPVGAVAGDKYIAYYMFDSGVGTEMMTIKSDAFSGTYKIVGDTVVTNYETKELESFQIVIYQARINSAFEITMEAEGDPSVFDMSIDVMKPDTHSRMIEMIKY